VDIVASDTKAMTRDITVRPVTRPTRSR